VLGGLIQEGTNRVRSGIPVLSDIPVLGNAFRTTDDQFDRTELLIFVRPRVLRSNQEAQLVTAEFRRRLDAEEPQTFPERARQTLERLR
jgi:general secretion pathway protein D